MDGFLVLMRFGCGDLPLAWFSTKGSAEVYALAIGWTVPEDVRKLFEVPSCPVNKSIVEFDGGTPVDVEIVERWEG